MSASEAASRAASNGEDAPLKEGDGDADDQFLESVKELVAMPFLTGVIQGFVSVGMQRRRERRAARQAAAEREKAAKEMVAAVRDAAAGGGAKMA